MNEIMFKTLDKMKNDFSSNEFSRIAKRFGLSKRAIANGAIANFLKINAIPGDSIRLWTKKHSDHNYFKVDKSDEILSAINLLKDNGYKVLKQVSDWIDA